MSRTDKDMPYALRNVDHRNVACKYDEQTGTEEVTFGSEAHADVEHSFRVRYNFPIDPAPANSHLPDEPYRYGGDIFNGHPLERRNKRPDYSSTTLNAELRRAKKLFNGGNSVEECDVDEANLRLDTSVDAF